MRSAFRGPRCAVYVSRYVVAFCVLRYVFAFCGLRFPFLRVFAFLFREQKASFSEETGFFQKLDFAEIRDHRHTGCRARTRGWQAQILGKIPLEVLKSA